jgi:putative Mn2+ efflux pump MntP
MGILSILPIAIGLSIDSLTISVASASVCKKKNRWLFIRFAIVLGITQAIFILLGWIAGLSLEKHFKAYDHWIAFALLLFIGGKLIFESLKNKDSKEKSSIDFNNILIIIGLGIATSIDALVVGISLPLMNLNIWLSSIIILVVTFIFSYLGLFFGDFMKSKLKRFSIEVIGGIFLITIGVKVFIDHLISGC